MNNQDYQTFKININNLNIPHLYLSSEEIIKFNEECKTSGIDLKVVSLSDYMNIQIEDIEDDDDINNINDKEDSSKSQLEDSFKEKEDNEKKDNNSIDEDKNIFMNNFQLNNKNNKSINLNQYINKKREKKINKLESESESENNKSIENDKDIDEDKNKSSFSFNSSSFNINQLQTYIIKTYIYSENKI